MARRAGSSGPGGHRAARTIPLGRYVQRLQAPGPIAWNVRLFPAPNPLPNPAPCASTAVRCLCHARPRAPAGCYISCPSPPAVFPSCWRRRSMASGCGADGGARALLRTLRRCSPHKLSGAAAWLHVQDFEVDAAFDLGFLPREGRRPQPGCAAGALPYAPLHRRLQRLVQHGAAAARQRRAARKRQCSFPTGSMSNRLHPWPEATPFRERAGARSGARPSCSTPATWA